MNDLDLLHVVLTELSQACGSRLIDRYLASWGLYLDLVELVVLRAMEDGHVSRPCTSQLVDILGC